MRRQQTGFTVVELILALTMASIMVGVLLMVTFRFYTNAMQSQRAAEMALESQTLLGQLTEDLRLSSGVASTNTVPDPNNAGGWTTSDASDVLVITLPATDSSDNIIYDADTGDPYTNDVIYFLNNGMMYKRILRNDAAAGNTAQTTCPAAAATPTCLSDRVFSENASAMTFDMYDTNNVATADPALSQSLFVQVDFAKNIFGKTVSLSNSTRITQRNF